jgi:hypothetical protein
VLERLANEGVVPPDHHSLSESVCRVQALRAEQRLPTNLWEALRDGWLSLSGSADWDEFIRALCIAWHGNPPKMPDTSPQNFAGPLVRSRPQLLGRAFHPRGGARRSQDEDLTPLSAPNPRLASPVATHSTEELHRDGLSGPMVWATWNADDPSRCPFAHRTCRGEADAVLGLNAHPYQQRIYVRYRPPAMLDLHIPLLTDAVVAGYHDSIWHPYFLPAPPDAPYGATRPLPPYNSLNGCPEAIHRSLKEVADLVGLQIEVVPLS